MATIDKSRKGDPKYIQVGIVGIRDPRNRDQIIENVPIYEEITDAHAERDVAACSDVAFARMLAQKIKQYQDDDGRISL